MVICNYAIRNRHRSKVEYAAPRADRELIRYTGDVIAHNAVGDHHCAGIVVNTAALATAKGNLVVSRAVAINRAIHDGQCRPAAIAIVVDTAPSEVGIVVADTAIENRQRGAAP